MRSWLIPVQVCFPASSLKEDLVSDNERGEPSKSGNDEKFDPVVR